MFLNSCEILTSYAPHSSLDRPAVTGHPSCVHLCLVPAHSDQLTWLQPLLFLLFLLVLLLLLFLLFLLLLFILLLLLLLLSLFPPATHHSHSSFSFPPLLCLLWADPPLKTNQTSTIHRCISLIRQIRWILGKIVGTGGFLGKIVGTAGGVSSTTTHLPAARTNNWAPGLWPTNRGSLILGKFFIRIQFD